MASELMMYKCDLCGELHEKLIDAIRCEEDHYSPGSPHFNFRKAYFKNKQNTPYKMIFISHGNAIGYIREYEIINGEEGD